MKIFITGASGMLGTDLVKIFSSRHEVTGAGRRPAHFPGYYTADLSRPGAAHELISKIKPAVIFHAAAWTDVDGAESKKQEALIGNFEMTRLVADAANDAGARIVLFSTDYVFDGKKAGEYTEDDATCPANFYGETKLLAENYVQQNARKFVIFRISWLYGLAGKSFPRTILERAKNQKKFDVVNDQTGRPTYTADVAQALAGALDRDPGFEKTGNQLYHLGNRGKASWFDFAAYILKQAGHADAEVAPMGSEKLNRPANRPANSVLALGKAEAKLGISMRGWQESVSDFINEFKKQETK